MALFGSVETLRQQLARPDYFAPALDYLRRALTPGDEVNTRIHGIRVGETQRVDLPHGMYALEQVYLTKPRAEGRFEAHRRHIDLQAIVQGEEAMEVADVRHLTESENLLAEKDVRFFSDFSAASTWRLQADEVAVFFPVDAHMPSLAISEPRLVYKTVVKVPVQP